MIIQVINPIDDELIEIEVEVTTNITVFSDGHKSISVIARGETLLD